MRYLNVFWGLALVAVITAGMGLAEDDDGKSTRIGYLYERPDIEFETPEIEGAGTTTDSGNGIPEAASDGIRDREEDEEPTENSTGKD